MRTKWENGGLGLEIFFVGVYPLTGWIQHGLGLLVFRRELS